MTLPNIFCFMNFFVRPTFKKWRQKCAKKHPKCTPPPPLTPRNTFFWRGGMCSHLSRPNNHITLHYMPNLRCSVPPNPFLTIGGCFSPKCAFLGTFRRSLKKSILFTFLDQTKILWVLKNRMVKFHLLHKPIKVFLKKTPKFREKTPPGGPPDPPDPPKCIFWVRGDVF